MIYRLTIKKLLILQKIEIMNFRRYLFILLLLPVSLLYAEYNPYFSFVKTNFPEDNDYETLKSLSSDIIFIEFPKYVHSVTNVRKVIPDTIFKKDKRPKNPKEGKHYTLQHLYKGRLEGNTYVTPAEEFYNKKFKLLAVDRISNPTVTPIRNGYSLLLQDLDTNERIYFEIIDSNADGVKLYSTRVNSEINKLKKDTVYIKYGKEDIDYVPYTLQNGTVLLDFSVGINGVKLMPEALFLLENERREEISLIYDSSNPKPQYNLISSAEYQDILKKHQEDLEARKVYEINYKADNDTTFIDLIRDFPENYILGNVTRTAYVSQTIKPGSQPLGYTTVPENTTIFIADELHVRGKDYYKATLDGKPFFIEKENVRVENPAILRLFASQPEEVKDALLKNAVFLSLYYMDYRLQELYKELKKFTDRGLVILGANVFDTSEYTEGTGVEFCIWNTSSKTIKYITFNYVGYNAVDDPVPNFGRTTLTFKGIGPIEPDYNGCYEEDLVWWTDIVEYCELKSVVVEYTNKTKRTYKGKELEELPEGLIEALDYTSPVEDFLPKYNND